MFLKEQSLKDTKSHVICVLSVLNINQFLQTSLSTKYLNKTDVKISYNRLSVKKNYYHTGSVFFWPAVPQIVHFFSKLTSLKRNNASTEVSF